MKAIRVLIVLCAALLCQTLSAQVGPPIFENLRVVSNPSVAGEPIVARMLFLECYPTTQSIDSFRVTTAEQVVTLTVQMSFDPNIICIHPPVPPSDIDFPLGAFAPGTYALVQQTLSGYPGESFAPLTTSFTVGGAPVSVPTLGPLPMLALAAMLAFAAMRLAGRTGRPREER